MVLMLFMREFVSADISADLHVGICSRQLLHCAIMHPLMFHSVHGSAIVLSEENRVATRQGNFCNGIAFSSKPFDIGQKLCLELTRGSEWSGAIRIGVTTHNPAILHPNDLPRFVCPDLTRKPGYWARALSENYGDSGNRITFYVNLAGQLHYFVNSEHKGIFLNHLPTVGSLWALFDIYGNTVSAKFVHPDEAPIEILARGPEAMQAYNKACESGTRPVFHTRLMLVGQECVGKTSLKKSLTGQRHNTAEESTDCLDLSASCSFNMQDRIGWQLAIKTEPKIEEEHQEEGRAFTTTGGIESLKEEYDRAIATNIVQELLHLHRLREPYADIGSSSPQQHPTHQSASQDLVLNTQNADNASVPSSPADNGHMSVYLKDHALLQEVPNRIVCLVGELMRERETSDHSQHSVSKNQSGNNILLNIWDFAGQAVYYSTHQAFLSSRAVYIIVFNLVQNLQENVSQQTSLDQHSGVMEGNDLSGLEYIDFWLHSIHAHTAQNTSNSVDNTTLSPPVFIVGTHRASLDPNMLIQKRMADEQFSLIRKFIESKPYKNHIIPVFYAVENNVNMVALEDDQLVQLRRHIEEVASREPYMGEQIPIKWFKFEQVMSKLVEEGTYFVSREQAQEVARAEGIISDQEFKTLLEFYHDLGVIIYYGMSDMADAVLRNSLIIKPQWLVDMFKRVIRVQDMDQQRGAYHDLWHRLETTGILEEKLINYVWNDVLDQKPALLRLMEKFDLICGRLPPRSVNTHTADHRSFFMPSRLCCCPDTVSLYSHTPQDVVFYLNFNGFLPDGLFHRVLTRAICWSQECGGHEPQLFYHRAKFFLDSEHDFVLEMGEKKLSQMKVSVLRVVDLDESDNSSSDSCTEEQKSMPPPKPASTAKVRNFLESTLCDLRELWMKRISYEVVVLCPCNQPCTLHDKPHCPHPACHHFLNLDECLTNKVVCCGHRRIKTSHFRKWFPEPAPVVKPGPILPVSVLRNSSDPYGNIEVLKGSELPLWARSAAKLLNGGSEGQDWTALAKKLGYKKNKIDKLNEDLNPGLALITDWIVLSGNTVLSVDMMITYLEAMQRDDIVEIIQKGRESEMGCPQVFISYQWDYQDEVSALYEKLELAGFSCWMDIGQMGGGDQLYTRIDEGLRACKVVIACVSPKYIVSHHCIRELSLADLLRKPIIPIMYDKVPWPPPGGMSLMLAQLVYINMNGVGGHGGSGIHSDLNSKYQEVIQRVSCHATPNPHSMMNLSPKYDVHKELGSLNSDFTFHSETRRNVTPTMMDQTIPRYVLETSEERQQVSPDSWQRRNTAAGLGSHGLNNQVEQVHVAKCAVCTIL